MLQNAPPEASSQIIHEATNQDSNKARTGDTEGDAHKFTTGATALNGRNPKSATSEAIKLPEVNESSILEDNVWVKIKAFIVRQRKSVDPRLSTHRQTQKFAQVLFKEQYPSISGFMSTLLQYKPLTAKLSSGIQIIHCCDVHWITAYKKFTVYDSLFDLPDDTLTKVITKIFDTSKLIMAPMQRQSPASNNCGTYVYLQLPCVLQFY